MKKRFLSMILSVVMTAILMSGCGSKPDAVANPDIVEEGAEESVLVYGSGDYDSINPIMNEHCEIKHLLFDSLVTRDGEGNLVTYARGALTADNLQSRINLLLQP